MRAGMKNITPEHKKNDESQSSEKLPEKRNVMEDLANSLIGKRTGFLKKRSGLLDRGPDMTSPKK